jgi:NAD(P)H dehydrogenase (quinone)
MYGHIRKLADAEKKGIEAAGGEATLYQYASIEASEPIR